jgi:hypothetical protein
MSNSRANSIIQIIGFPNSGKKYLIESIQDNVLLNESIKLFFNENSIFSSINAEDSMDEIIKECSLNFNFAKRHRHWVFCIDPTQHLNPQFKAIRRILDYLQKSKNILVPYSLFISKMDLVDVVKNRDKIHQRQKAISPNLPLPLQTMYSGTDNLPPSLQGFVNNIIKTSRTNLTIDTDASIGQLNPLPQ